MNRKSLTLHILLIAIAFTLVLPAFSVATPDAAERDLQPGSPVIMQAQELVQALKKPASRWFFMLVRRCSISRATYRVQNLWDRPNGRKASRSSTRALRHCLTTHLL